MYDCSGKRAPGGGGGLRAIMQSMPWSLDQETSHPQHRQRSVLSQSLVEPDAKEINLQAQVSHVDSTSK